ncbi:MAG: hypothetical protein GY849_08075 [Deltaproteobacteria bacterium]|nr:hypothetical protein [Deltaproteobacteria bacterium]
MMRQSAESKGGGAKVAPVATADEEGISSLCGARATLSDNLEVKSCCISQGTVSCPQQQQGVWRSLFGGPAPCPEPSGADPIQHGPVQEAAEGVTPAPKRERANRMPKAFTKTFLFFVNR